MKKYAKHVVKRAGFSTLKEMSKDFLVHLRNTRAPHPLRCLFVSLKLDASCNGSVTFLSTRSTAPGVGCGCQVLHSAPPFTVIKRELVRSSVSPSIKWEEAHLPPQKFLVPRSGSARDCSFPFPPVSLLHSSKWWPTVAMVTQHRVMLPRNNDNWWQQGSRAEWWLASEERPVCAERQQRKLFWAWEGLEGELHLTSRARMRPVSGSWRPCT